MVENDTYGGLYFNLDDSHPTPPIDKKHTDQWREKDRDKLLTCEQIPQVVGFDGFLLSSPSRLTVTELVAGDEAVLRVGRRRLPAHFNTLKVMRMRINQIACYLLI